MDRSDHLLYAAVDPPTGKTQPPDVPAQAAQEPPDAPAAAGDDRAAPPAEPAAPEEKHAPEEGADAELWAPLSIPPEPPRPPWPAAAVWPEPAPAEPAPEPPEPVTHPLEEPALEDTAALIERPGPPHANAPDSQLADQDISALSFEEPPKPSAEESEPAPSAAPAWQPTHVDVPAPTLPPQAPRAKRLSALVERAAKLGATIFAGWFCAVLLLTLAYRFINPPFSSLMAMQWLTGTSIEKQWVPLERISPHLIRAVVVSEDGRFCEHWGIDFLEIAQALKRTTDGVPRGASTITMQVAKNLFLWPAKSYVRKLIEVPLTYAIELAWPKWRILEVYLNIAEWGPGVFGAEAAAQAHFNQPASRLSSRQAAQLAVALPNPLRRDAGDPGPWTARRASVIQRRMGHEPEAVACLGLGD